MANGYTVVPSVIPGNLNIGGDLDVKGEIRVGPFSPRLHLWMIDQFTAAFTYNWKKTDAGGDAGGFKSQVMYLGDGTQLPRFRYVNTAATQLDAALIHRLFTAYGLSTHTGTVTEDTIYTKTIPANLLGTNGGLRIVLQGNGAVQGAGNSTVRIKFGGVVVTTILLNGATPIPFYVETVIANLNAINAQRVSGQQQLNGVMSTLNATPAVNTAANQDITITIQNANAGDTQTIQLVTIELINSFGPVN